jgi:putative ABC transport system substrate-binding protein
VKRRTFIRLLGGAAAAWPLAGPTQELGKIPRVAYVRSGIPTNDPFRETFVRGMRDLGYVEGRNVAFEFRHYGDDVGSIAALVGNLLQTKIDVIVVAGTPAVRAVQAATQGIPIVMMIAADPLGTGLIAGLARPGGNTTGLALLSSELAVKRLELLKELMPQAVRIAILRQPGNPA